jgi:nucleotide-binding universal stress UspA family protein
VGFGSTLRPTAKKILGEVMTLARILVPVRGDGKGEGVIGHAAALARRLAAHIEAVHCRARPDDMMPYGVAVPAGFRDQIRQQAAAMADSEEKHLHGLFDALMAKLGIDVIAPDATPPQDRPSASWCEEQGRQIDVVRAHGRLADLVAVARPDRTRNLGFNTLKAGLFQTARPVLLCPPVAPADTLGHRVAIAWNGSLEGARTLALSWPLLAAAEEVVVLDGGETTGAACGATLQRRLAERGIPARHLRIDAGDGPGAAILSGAKSTGADLVMMGAYGHSREYEAMFGGATQHVVDETTLPVIMAH